MLKISSNSTFCHFIKSNYYFDIIVKTDGVLFKYAGRRLTERYILLFDGLIVLTKVNTRRASVTGPVGEYKLKEKFNIRKIDIVDREDTEGRWSTHYQARDS